MSNNLVDVWMITYNHAPYIADAIESVLMQEADFRYRLLIGDDSSTDGTQEIVRGYAKKYPNTIKLYLNERNLGPQENAIRLYRQCTGRYMALLDGDDYWIDAHKLQKQVGFLEAHDEYGLVHTEYDEWKVESGEYIHAVVETIGRKTTNDFDNQFEALLLRQAKHPMTCTLCFRTDLFNKIVNFDDFYRYSMGDSIIIYEFAKHSKLHFINEPTAVHRILSESIVHTKSIYKLLEFKRSGMQLKLDLIRKYKVPKSVEQYVTNRYYRFLVKYLVFKRDPPLARAVFRYYRKTTFLDRSFVLFMLSRVRPVRSKLKTRIQKRLQSL